MFGVSSCLNSISETEDKVPSPLAGLLVPFPMANTLIVAVFWETNNWLSSVSLIWWVVAVETVFVYVSKLFEYSMTTYQGTNHEEIYTKGVQILGDLQTNKYASHKTKRWQTLFGVVQNFYLWYDIDINNLYSYSYSILNLVVIFQIFFKNI